MNALDTGGGTRTHTPLRETDFESVASADSATPAVRAFDRIVMTTAAIARDQTPDSGALARMILRPCPRRIQSVTASIRRPHPRLARVGSTGRKWMTAE